MLVGSSSCRVEFLVEADEYTSTPWKPYFLRSRESYGIVFGKKRIIPKNFAFAEYVRSQPCLACLALFDLASTTLFLPVSYPRNCTLFPCRHYRLCRTIHED